MAKNGSGGVNASEKDLSAPVAAEVTGIPAVIIGTSQKGPAFVPTTFGNFNDFKGVFGKTDGKKFGPLAVREWLNNASAATYLRVLGVGQGKKRETDDTVAAAGFVVGENQPSTVGTITSNPYANTNGVPGRTYFLGCLMSESNGSTFFSSAGLQGTGGITPDISSSVPIIRGVLMAASGVLLRLSSSVENSVKPVSSLIADDASARGSAVGTVVLTADGVSKQEFVMLLNGHKGTDAKYPNCITASFDITAPNYFANVFNTDPFKLQQAGHYLYASWDVHSAIAVVTGAGYVSVLSGAGATSTAPLVGAESAAFLLTSSLGRNAGSTTVPNYENFEDRYSAAKTPWIVSQKFGGVAKNLFRLHAIDDGESTANKIKFSIENLTPSSDTAYQYGTFDLIIRDITDRDTDVKILEQFRGLSLDPSSDRYVAKAIGDLYTYYDWNRVEKSQKLVTAGNYPQKSRYVRVEVSTTVENGEIDATALPMGVRGIAHLVTSGSAPLQAVTSSQLDSLLCAKRTLTPPVPLRQNITLGTGQKQTVQPLFYWGVKFEHSANVNELNSSVARNRSFDGYARYMPNFYSTNMNVVAADNQGVADTAANGILDADHYCTNVFSLENIKVTTASNTYADSTKWNEAVYVRNGSIAADDTAKTRALSTSDLTTPNKKYIKFSFFMQGGFDGVNIFNEEESKISNIAVTQDMESGNGRGTNLGPSVRSYIKAIDIVKEVTNIDAQIIAIPGIRHSVVTDAALLATEDRFDALYIMDIEERDSSNFVVTSSTQLPSVNNTSQEFLNRGLDSSFGAAYFPDVVITDPTTNSNVQCPPSVAVLGALALNDRLAFPWFAPAGFTRGALNTTVNVAVKLSKDNMNVLYDADINPIVSFPGQAPVVWGQKTLLAAQSALDRVNVRRLLISLRRDVRNVARTFLFEPNRDATLARFASAVEPILDKAKKNAGVDRYLVKIDTTTTTQADVENNTIRGKIYVQPTRSIEFVSLEFVVSNSIPAL